MPEGCELTYGEVLDRVRRVQSDYAASGYGSGHRAAVLLENRPEFFFHFLALNGLGASIVPINPDLLATEIAYILEHSEADVVVGLGPRLQDLREVASRIPKQPPVVGAETWTQAPPMGRSAASGPPTEKSEAAILYTSGTTGRPKGCILTNQAISRIARLLPTTSGSGCVLSASIAEADAGADRLLPSVTDPFSRTRVGSLQRGFRCMSSALC